MPLKGGRAPTLHALFLVALLSSLGCEDASLKRLGDTCQQESECSSGRCDELVCKSFDPHEEGETCVHNFECGSEVCSVTSGVGLCDVGQRVLGGVCTADLQCSSASCVAGQCTATVADGATDGSKDGGLPLDSSKDGAGIDADASPIPNPGEHLWHKTFGSAVLSESIRGVVMDDSGNITIVGVFEDTFNLGSSDIVSEGNRDIFIASFTSEGLHRWQKSLGGSGDSYVRAVTVDARGHITLTGYFQETVELGGGSITSRGSDDIFITSFTADGVHRWQERLGGAHEEQSVAIVADASGNITLTGSYKGTINLGDGFVTSKGIDDIFITSFTADGSHRWQKTMGGPENDRGQGVAVDGNGNVSVIGSFQGTSELSNGSVTSKGFYDIFITSFTADGSHRWQKTISSPQDDSGQGVAADSNGNVTVVGAFTQTIDPGGGEISCSGNIDIFISSFTDAGVHRWQKALGGTGFVGSANADAVVTNDHGDITLIGDILGTIDLGGGNLTSLGWTDAFVTSFSADGTHRWQQVWGGTGFDYCHALAVGRGGVT
ncbi:MAG: hypothetical protein JRH20_11225, partial [Deltaproteobacteria bacterium]|nr:hypothetical protein [Deltaproteobacteria bacterium]